MTTVERMGFGIFMAPFHRIGENPTLALERDLELIQVLDRLGYDEAWVGEHHSAGWEIIASPEVFIAAAAERTRHIRLGTGVSSLPYHHPYILAQRMVQLDHMTRGRAMLGIGPGALSSDAYMLGIDPVEQRRKMDEGLEAIMALFESDEPVTRKTDWFEMNEARLHLRPYTNPRMHVAVASIFSPAGPAAAGRHGCGLLSVGASQPGALVDLPTQWGLAEEAADKAGKEVSRSEWRLVQPFYLAEDRDQAFEECREGARVFNQEYFEGTLGRPATPEAADIALQVKAGAAIVGTPDDAIEAIERLQEASGGFGGLLGLAHEWAPQDKVHKSFELFARYVMPKFQGQLAPTDDSQKWVAENRTTIFGTMPAAMVKAFKDAGKEIPQEMAEQMRR